MASLIESIDKTLCRVWKIRKAERSRARKIREAEWLRKKLSEHVEAEDVLTATSRVCRRKLAKTEAAQRQNGENT